MGTDSSPLKSYWQNICSFLQETKDRACYPGNVIVFVLCIPSWLAILYFLSWITGSVPWWGSAAWLLANSGSLRGAVTVTAALAAAPRARMQMEMSVGWEVPALPRRTSHVGFLSLIFEAVSVPLPVRKYQYLNTRHRWWPSCHFSVSFVFYRIWKRTCEWVMCYVWYLDAVPCCLCLCNMVDKWACSPKAGKSPEVQCEVLGAVHAVITVSVLWWPLSVTAETTWMVIWHVRFKYGFALIYF